MSNLLASAVLGVDPGTQGAASVLNASGDPVFIGPFRPDMTESELVHVAELAAAALRREKGNVCYFEKTGYMKGDGGRGAYTFGLVNGLVRGALLAMKVEVRLVPPMLWQSRLQALSGGSKAVTRLRAQQIFPSAFPRGMFKYQADNIADSLLLAKYGHMMESL
jgi:hypothetical protein